MITYQTIDIRMPAIARREVTRWVRAVAATYGKTVGDVAYIFCDDEKILEVNRQYLQHDYYTDIITFDYTEANRIGGDLFISVDTVRTNAEGLGKDYSDELHRVIIHGILHLCGINDKGPGERQVMEAAEDPALALLADLRRAEQPSTPIDTIEALENLENLAPRTNNTHRPYELCRRIAVARYAPPNDAGHGGTAGPRTSDGLRGYRPHGRLAPYRAPLLRHDAPPFPARRT